MPLLVDLFSSSRLKFQPNLTSFSCVIFGKSTFYPDTVYI